MKDEKNTRYNIGDEVVIVNTETMGTVKSIISYLGDGNNVYLVNANGKEKIYVESNLEICRKNNVAMGLNINEVVADFQIEGRINEIIKILNLNDDGSEKSQLLNACKLQFYLVKSKSSEDKYFNIGSSVLKNELYHGLFKENSDSIINSYVFSEILNRLNMQVLNIALKNKNMEYYVANLVLIGREYYYFDVTLEKKLFNDSNNDINEYILSWAALGSDSYETIFTPLCILNFKNILDENMLPHNIAVSDIDINIVNKILREGKL